MNEAFPFSITHNPEAMLDDSSWQLYQALTDFDTSELSAYKLLSDKYSRTWRISLIDTTALIIEERAPELLDHIEFDEEGYLLDIFLDSDAALNTFITIICPVFQQLLLLEDYMRRVADREKA